MQRIDIQHNIEPGKSYNQNCVISKKCTTNNNDCTSANTFGDFKVYLQLIKK